MEQIENAQNDITNKSQERDMMESEISSLNEGLDQANMLITNYQQEIQNWKSLAEYYRNSFSKYYDGLSQVSLFLQDLKAGVHVIPLGN